MSIAFSEGDRVEIVDREANADDVKTNLFFNHFRRLTGTVQKVYASGEAAVEIEIDSLSETVAQRHREVQEKMKADWLDKLSEEARNRLSPQERDFRLRYTVLVRASDLAKPTNAAVAKETVAEAPRRVTAADLAAAEEAELRRRQNGK
jgi:glutamate/tyrosine decarboxylase-like PLP-dependent enzyme